MLDAKAREALAGIQGKIGSGLARLGISANALTALGLLVAGLAAWQIVDRAFVAGGLLLIVSGVIDIFDGAVARARGQASPWGAFVDSVSDRISDGVVLGALAWVFASDGEPILFVLTLVGLVGALATSYIRAKAEGLGFSCRVGLIERAERLVLLIVGLVLGLLPAVLWILAVGSTFTVLQRIVHVGRQARARG